MRKLAAFLFTIAVAAIGPAKGGSNMPEFVKETEFSIAGAERDAGAVAWSPDGNQLAVLATLLRYATVFSVPSGKALGTIGDFVGGPHDIGFAPDGNVLVPPRRAYHDALNVWNPQTGATTIVAGPDLSENINTNMLLRFALNAQGTRLAGLHSKRAPGVAFHLAIYNTSNWTLLADHPTGGTGLAMSPDGTKVALIGRYGIEIYDTDSGASKLRFQPNMNDAAHIDWSPDGRRIATGVSTTQGFGFDTRIGKPGRLRDAEDTVLQLWDAETGTRLASTSEALGSGVEWLEFSRDGRWLVTTTADGVCRLWDAKTLELRQVVVRNLHPNTALARFSPDSRRLAVIRTGLARATIYRLQ